MPDDNVIKGPWSARTVTPTSDDAVVKMKIDLIAAQFSDALFEGISELGFDNYDDMCYSKDYALLVHAIKSVLYRLDERYHPLQDVAENIFTLNPDDSLSFNQSINLEFE